MALMDNLTLAVTLRAFDQMSRVVATAASNAVRDYAKIQEQVKKTSEGMQRVGAVAIAGGAAIGAAAIKPINAYADLEDAVTRAKVAFMTTDGIDKGFAEVERVAQSLGGKLPGTVTDFTLMATKLKELGLSTTAIAHGGLEASAYLRVLMGNVAPESIAEMTATFKASLGIAEAEFVDFVDLVQRQKFAFGVDPHDFALTTKYIGSMGKQLGLTGFEASKSTVALTGMLSQAGIKGEQLGTSLRAVLNALPTLNSQIAKSKELGPILSKAGIALEFFDKQGQFKGIENFVFQLDKLQRLNPQARLAVLKELFGTESASAMAELVGQGVEGYNKAQQTLLQQANLQSRLNLVMGTFRNMWEAAMGATEMVFATFGGAIAADLKRGADAIGQVAERIDAWAQAHPRLTRVLTLGTLSLGGFLVVGGGALLLLGTMGHGLATAIGGFGKMAKVAGDVAPSIGKARDTVKGFVENTRAMQAIQYRGGLWPALQHQLLLTRYRMLEAVASTRTWVASQLAAFRANFLTVSGLRTLGTTLLTNVVAGLKGATLAARAFTVTLLANPFTWVALGIGGTALLIWKYWQPIAGFFKGFWAGLREGAAPVFQALAPGFRALAVQLAPVTNLLRGVWGWVTRLLRPVQDTGGAANNLGRSWGLAIGRMLASSASLVSGIARFYGAIFNAGRTMVTMLWQGIQSMASKPAEAMAAAVQKVRNLLPFSPAKDGPLRDIHRIRLVETIAESVRPAPLVTAMTRTAAAVRSAVVPLVGGDIAGLPRLAFAASAGGAAVSLPARGGMPSVAARPQRASAGGTSIHYAPTFHLPAGSGGDIRSQVMEILRQDKDELARIVQRAMSSRERTRYE